jgi:hypothetical protein
MKDLYVSSVPGRLVFRFGTSVLIGATRSPENPKQVSWDADKVVRIPAAEARQYAREYAGAFERGDLQKRSRPKGSAPNRRETKAEATE